MTYSVVSLFSGAGGLDTGVDATGSFKLLGCVELEHQFCETLRVNRDEGRFGQPETEIIEADLSTLDPLVLMDKLQLKPGELDLLIGGPPCQSFSTAGRRRTVEDPRGELLWDFLRFVEALQPRYFIMENVRGLLSAGLRHRPIAERPNKGGPPLAPDEEPGSVIDLWARDAAELKGAAYRIDCFEVNAVNYGAPQLRERAIFIGNRENQLVDFPWPTHGLPDAATGLPLDSTIPVRTLGDAIRGMTEADPVIMDFSPRKKKYLSMIPPGGNWRTLTPEVAQESMGGAYFAKGGRSGWWRRLSWDLPSPTIVTMPNHASTSMCHPDEIRTLTVAECARVQEFPEGWKFVGTPAEQYAQVGNAVPARLGRVAGEVVAKYLDRRPARKSKNLPPFRRIYLKSHVRTRQWWKAGQVFVWDGVGGNAHYGQSAVVGGASQEG